jgi:hypothetical protein
MEDVPFEVRSYLYQMCLSADASTPLAIMLRRHALDHEYANVYSRIRGTMNMTPTCLLQLCRMYDDYTPIQLLGAEYGIGINVVTAIRMSGDVVGEVLQANAAMGAVNEELRVALAAKNITKEGLAKIAHRAAVAMREVGDVINAAGRAR